MGKSKAKPKPAAHAARVRMYRHGLGDCFLLSFPRPAKRDFRILVDCGVILGTPNEIGVIGQVVADLREATDEKGTPTIDVFVATHEHWDHLSAFATVQDQFANFAIGEAWLAWTEKPKDEQADKLRKERQAKLNSLKKGVVGLRMKLTEASALGADGQSGAAADDFRRVAEVLTFYGVDPSDPEADAVAFAAAGGGRKTIGEAMKFCRDDIAQATKYREPGEVIDLGKEVKGLRVYVLGPPRNEKQLRKDAPTKRGRETYEEAEGKHGLAFLGADGTEADFAHLTPFGQKYRIDMEAAATDDFFRTHYFGHGPEDPDDWRRIDGNGLADAARFALQLDSDTNNTSLALAFELPDGRVLLFPGDAQVGNWESWHSDADADGKKPVWKGRDGDVTAEQLLRNTVLYKVGHHGSHNATLRAQGLEMMGEKRLVALVPVDTYIAHEKKGWGKMPFDPLMETLRSKTEGRVIVADQPVDELPKGTFAKDEAVDATKMITVTGAGDKPVTRPLYVDVFVPAK